MRETASVPHFGMESSPEASPDVSKVVKAPMMSGHCGEREDLKAQRGWARVERETIPRCSQERLGKENFSSTQFCLN